MESHNVVKSDPFIMMTDVFESHVRRNPTKKAFTFLKDGEENEVSITYEELERKSKIVASLLMAEHQMGERAILLYPPGIDFIIAFWGCLFAGIVAVPAYLPGGKHTTRRFKKIIDDCLSGLILTTNSYQKKSERIDQSGTSSSQIKFITTDDLADKSTHGYEAPPVHGNTPVLLQYTSGSTGDPKGVVITHFNLMENAGIMQQNTNVKADEVFVCWLPAQHDMGLMGTIIQPLYLGTHSVIMSPLSFLQKPIRWLKAISRFGASVTVSPNFGFELCVRKTTEAQRHNLDLSTLNLVCIGAEPVRYETIEEFSNTFESNGFRKSAFYPCYGLAETTLFVSGGPKLAENTVVTVTESMLSKLSTNENTENKQPEKKLVGCGIPLKQTKVIIVDPDTKEKCTAGQVGEIWVSAPNNSLGYWNKPELNHERMQAYTKNMVEGPFLRTGDLGFFRDDMLFIAGRLDDLIILKGRNIYPQDLEFAVQEWDPLININGCACFVTEDENLVLVIEKKIKDKSQCDEYFKMICAAMTSEFGIGISAISLVKKGTIPRATSGKIQRFLCRNMFLSDTLKENARWEKRNAKDHPPIKPPAPNAGQPNRESLTAWFKNKISHLVNVDLNDIDQTVSLLDFGLDSVNLGKISGDLQSDFGISVSPTIVFECPTIDALCNHILKLDTETEDLDQHQIICNTDEGDELDEIKNMSREELKNELDKLVSTDHTISI